MFTSKVFYNGPIVTVHVVDEKENLSVGVSEKLEDAIGKAVSNMYNTKMKKHPALDLLEELVETADFDSVFDKAEKLLKGDL